jgi:hypothetical protein
MGRIKVSTITNRKDIHNIPPFSQKQELRFLKHIGYAFTVLIAG